MWADSGRIVKNRREATVMEAGAVARLILD